MLNVNKLMVKERKACQFKLNLKGLSYNLVVLPEQNINTPQPLEPLTNK